VAELLSNGITTGAELGLLVAESSMIHEQRSEFVGRHLTRRHLEQIGERVPEALEQAGDIDAIPAEVVAYATASAGSWVRSLDPDGLGRQPLHVVTTEVVGVESAGLGFTIPGNRMFDIVADHLPHTAEAGPVIFVTVAAHLRQIAEHLGDDDTDEQLRQRLRVAMTATVMHEAAHVIEQQAAGQAVAGKATLDTLRAVRAAPPEDKPHTATWARCLGHLVRRSMHRPPAGYWRPWLVTEVEHDIPGTGRRWFAVLEAETAATDPNEPLIEVISRPNDEFEQAITQRRQNDGVDD